MVVSTELIGIAGVERVRRHAPAALTSVLSETRSESGKNLLFLSEKGRGIWHSAGGTRKATAFLKSPIVALKAISIFYISEAVGP
jgi:hypothetical protein